MKRPKIYAASGLALVAFGAATYGGVTLSSGPAAASHPTRAAVMAAPAPPPPSIPQGNGGDGDPDNNGAPSDGDGNV
jgi:hypothetical protein